MVTPPIIVIDGHDFAFYDSLEAVGRHLEPWYPEGEYLAFDSEGRKLILVVEKRTVPRRWLPDRSFDWVGVRPSESEPTHADELAALLREHLELAGLSPQGFLEELLQRAVERSGYT